MTYVKDKTMFLLYKSMLDGFIFWKELSDNKVEIKIAAFSKQLGPVIQRLKD